MFKSWLFSCTAKIGKGRTHTLKLEIFAKLSNVIWKEVKAIKFSLPETKFANRLLEPYLMLQQSLRDKISLNF